MDHRLARILVVFALSGVLALGGCGEPAREAEVVDAQSRILGTVLVQSYTAGMSVRNRPIECMVLSESGVTAEDPDVILIMATIHGSEPAGTALVGGLAEHLKKRADLVAGRLVLLMPVANPDGLAVGTRHNARGVDLNRNFAAANRLNSAKFGMSALSEPEARTIEMLIRQYMPNRIVSIHQPLRCIDYDGPAYGLARRMRRYCDLPVKRLGAHPGSLGSFAGVTLGIPTITLELPRHAHKLSDEVLWKKYGEALVAAVTYTAEAK